MSLENHYLAYQTICGGIAIVNGADHQIGTLGFVARCDKGEPWIVSCYHVLYPSSRRLQTGEKELIYQPSQSRRSTPIAEITNERVHEGLDLAAARLTFGLPSAKVLHLGRLGAPTLVQRGTRVLKSGVKTGVTEGLVLSVSEQEIMIGTAGDAPEGYSLTDVGDSGALWVRADDMAPVGVHFEGNVAGDEWAKARPIQLVIDVLRLQWLTP